MPGKQFFIVFAFVLAAVGLALAVFLQINKGQHLELTGEIKKVRVQAMDEASCVAVADFRATNPSDLEFIVRGVTVSIEDSKGEWIEGSTIAEVDAKRVFLAFPALGQKYNESLRIRDKAGPRTSMDRMISARFELPAALVESRRNLKIRIEEVDRTVSEILEKKQ